VQAAGVLNMLCTNEKVAAQGGDHADDVAVRPQLRGHQLLSLQQQS
jgi:hypothetical protein